MDTVTCPICGKEFKQLTAQHIFTHNITVKEFREKFPDCYLGNPSANHLKIGRGELQGEIDNIRCKQCDKLITGKYRKQKIFCSHTCSAIYNNSRKIKKLPKIKKCIHCGNSYTSRDNKSKYCSSKCQHIYNNNKRIKRWKDTTENGGHFPYAIWIRRYLFQKYDNKCCRCGWNKVNPTTGLIPLEVEHIDGNSDNNREDNLELLCPCCHSLTPTYKGANMGNGRFKRMERYRAGKSY